MTYLSTGATGFIGKKLVNVLLERGHSVNYLARKRSPDIDPTRRLSSLEQRVGRPSVEQRTSTRHHHSPYGRTCCPAMDRRCKGAYPSKPY